MPPGTCAEESPETAFSGGHGQGVDWRKKGRKRTVNGDADEVTDFLDFGPSQLERTKVPEHEVTVCSARLELVSVLDELLCKRPGVFDHQLRICLPGRLGRLQQRGRDARDGVIVGPTLARREHSIIHTLLEISVSLAILAEEDKAGARAT